MHCLNVLLVLDVHPLTTVEALAEMPWKEAMLGRTPRECSGCCISTVLSGYLIADKNTIEFTIDMLIQQCGPRCDSRPHSDHIWMAPTGDSELTGLQTIPTYDKALSPAVHRLEDVISPLTWHVMDCGR